MFITNFSHFGFLAVQNLWTERHKNENNLRLSGESKRSVLWFVTVDFNHVINVIVFHTVNEGLNQLGAHLESLEILTGILFWHNFNISCFIELQTSMLAKLCNFGRSLCECSVLVANIASHNTLSSNRRNKAIKQQKHDTIVVYTFN